MPTMMHRSSFHTARTNRPLTIPSGSSASSVPLGTRTNNRFSCDQLHFKEVEATNIAEIVFIHLRRHTTRHQLPFTEESISSPMAIRSMQMHKRLKILHSFLLENSLIKLQVAAVVDSVLQLNEDDQILLTFDNI